MSGSGSSREFEGDAGAPLPDFSATNINLTTVAPALGVPRSFEDQPDYLEYDQKGRGVVVTMFANTGMSYMLGIGFGGLYGLREGLANTPSSRLKVKVNSVLNHCGKHGSRMGNTLGVLSIMYSLYDWVGDELAIEDYTGPVQPVTPALAAFMTGATYYGRAGPRVAALAGTIGLGAVGTTYIAYNVLGIPYGHRGYLFF